MKLKQRLVTTICIFALLLVTMAISIYYYSEIVLIRSAVIPISHNKMTLKRIILQDIPRVRIPRKKRRKHRKVRIFNGTEDSNRAIELQLTDQEYEELLKKKQILPHRSTSIFATTYESPDTDDLKARYYQECIQAKQPFDLDDNREEFQDLVELLHDSGTSTQLWKSISAQSRTTIQEIHDIELESNLTNIEQFYLKISNVDMYAEDDLTLDALLNDLNEMPIARVEEKEGGTQLKLIITFKDGSQAMFKPMRFDRSKETLPDHFYFTDYERHTSEIAAFHLDRILGFRRCPPVTGRTLNITTEIYAVANDELLKTFFISPAQNICFHGHCSYYCDTGHAFCGHPDTLEGSVAAFLPPDALSSRKSWKNPWRRSYHKRKKAKWETNNGYCKTVRKQQPIYNKSKRLADLVDTSILDFLMGNMDRHHYETFQIFGNHSFILHLDHGRGFGKSKHDETTILAPLYQCCFMHLTTFHRLLQLQLNPMKLSTLMRCSLYKDPLNPILLDKHLEALDRRLEIILNVLRDCFKKYKSSRVLFYDREIESRKFDMLYAFHNRLQAAESRLGTET